MSSFTPPAGSDSTSQTSEKLLPPAGAFNSKRPVARRACLACREKKIKCDGDPPPSAATPDGEQASQDPKTCSNCRYLGIECVFVRSNRGGRRRKRTGSFDPLSEASLKLLKPSSTGSTSSLSLGSTQTTRNQLEYLHQRNSAAPHHRLPPPLSISGRSSPSLESQSTASYYRDYQGHEYYEKFSSRSGHSPPSSPGYRHLGPRSPFPFPPAPGAGPGGPPPPPFFSGRHYGPGPHFGPHHHPPPPPPPPPPFGYGHHHPPPPPPPPFGYGHHHRGGRKWRHMWEDHYQLPPPQAMISANSDSGSKVGLIPVDMVSNSAATTTTTTSSSHTDSTPFVGKPSPGPDRIAVAPQPALAKKSPISPAIEDVLSRYSLPDLRTSEILCDLYYRYIHPSFQVLPDKISFLSSSLLAVKSRASLLHAVFAVVSQYASLNVIASPEHRDHAYYFHHLNRYWRHLNSVDSVSTYMLLYRYAVSLGDFGKAHSFLDSALNMVDLHYWYDTLRSREPLFYEKLHASSTEKQLAHRAHKIRLLWTLWECHLQFQQLTAPATSAQMHFPTNIEMPSLEGSHLSWNDIQLASSEDQLTRLELSQFLIVSNYMMDELCKLTANMDVADFNAKLDKLIQIAQKHSYKVTSLHSSSIILDKKIVVIDAQYLKSTLQLHSLRMMTCADAEMINWLIFKPLSYQKGDKNFELAELPHRLAQDFFLANLNKFCKLFKSAWLVVKCLKIPYGNIEDSSGNFPVVLGPTMFKTSLEILEETLNSADQLPSPTPQEPWWLNFDDHNSVTAVRDPDVPDLWALYPFTTSSIVSQTIEILLSITLVLTLVKIRKEGDLNQRLVLTLYKDPIQTPQVPGIVVKEIIVENAAEIEMHNVPLEELSLTHLLADLRICYGFLKSQSRYSAQVSNDLKPIDELVQFVDNVLREIR